MLDFNRYFQSVLNRGYLSSAMSGLLWLNALVSVPCIFASFVIDSPFRWAPFGLASVIILFSLWMHNKLVGINPRLVQSEKYQVEMQKLDIVAEKGGPIVFDTVDIPLSEDPKRLSEGGSQSIGTGGEHD